MKVVMPMESIAEPSVRRIGTAASGLSDHDAYLQIIDGTTIAIQILRPLFCVITMSYWVAYWSFRCHGDAFVTKRLGYQASHPLTGLINRSAFETILQDVVKESVMTAGHSVLVFLDLDHFKQVNDTAGHAAGDELLNSWPV